MSSLRLRLHPTMDLILRPRGLQILEIESVSIFTFESPFSGERGIFHSLEYVRLAGFFHLVL